MAELNIGAICVVDHDELCGVFSERDLLKRVVVERLDTQKTCVGVVMTKEPITIAANASMEDAIHLMRHHNVRHLPVMDGGFLTGFLSLRDLMNYDLERKTEEVYHMRAYIHGSA
jgi:CBS domain-containing protein